MNQHTILQREKTTTSYASILDLFLLQIFQQFSGAQGKSQSNDDVLACALKSTWSKSNTAYWTCAIPYESGWHAFYNHVFLTERTGKLSPQSFTVSARQ